MEETQDNINVFPLLDLPHALISRILEFIPAEELAVVRSDRNIDSIALGTKGIANNNIFLTTTVFTLLRRSKEHSAVAHRTSVREIVRRLDRARSLECEIAELQLLHPSEFDTDLVQLLCRPLRSLSCSDGYNFPVLSNFFTDDFLLKTLENKKVLELTLLCSSVSARSLIAVYKAFTARKMQHFSIYVPEVVVGDLLDEIGLMEADDHDGKLKKIGNSRAWKSEGIVIVGNHKVAMTIYTGENSCPVRHTLTGEDCLIEMKTMVAQLKDMHSWLKKDQRG